MNEYVCVCFNICKMHKRERIYGNTSSNKMGVRRGFWLWLVARLSWRQTDLHAATAFCPSRKVTHTNQLRRTTFGTCLNNNPSTWTPFHISIILFFFLSFSFCHSPYFIQLAKARQEKQVGITARRVCCVLPILHYYYNYYLLLLLQYTYINTEQIN